MYIEPPTITNLSALLARTSPIKNIATTKYTRRDDLKFARSRNVRSYNRSGSHGTSTNTYNYFIIDRRLYVLAILRAY